MTQTQTRHERNVQFGSTQYADSVPKALAPSPGPVYLEGRLVLSLSFQGQETNLVPIADDEVVLENYRLFDELSSTWYKDELAVLRFEHADVVMRLDPTPTAIWSGSLDTQARVVLVPDFDSAGFTTNQTCDLCWKRI